jgi:hypothetical protein
LIQLKLFLPGLFGPPSGAPGGDVLAPALQTLLARAERSDTGMEHGDALLFRLFGIDTGRSDPPVAALTWLADTGQVPTGWWYRADPVHLQPRRDHLVLLDSTALDIEAQESAALESVINGLLGEDGWQLWAPRPGRWYLQPGRPLQLLTRTLEAVTGEDIRSHLPAGPDARLWQARLSEIQMLLHAHPLNQAREADGRPTINSLWLWGGGELPVPGEAGWSGVWTDDALTRGLALCSGIEVAPLPANAAVWLAAVRPGSYLITSAGLRRPARIGGIADWEVRIEQWNGDWFEPLLQSLRDRRLASLMLHDGAGRAARVTPASLRRWWRRRRPLSAYR